MGILYSHVVFQPPSPPTYSDDAGVITFKKMRTDPDDSADDDPPATDVSYAGSLDLNNLVHHPIFYLNTSKGNVIPAAYFHQHDSYYTILFSHGNGEDLGATASYALELSNSLKASVLCYDYSGYGLSTGKPSESNCYADIRAAYNYLISEKRIPARRIILFGRSLGSGPTVDLAASLGRHLGGVVLIAALTSCVRVVFSNVPHTMKFDMFPNIDKIDNIVVPVFCVHGMVDDVVPFSHGLELVKQARYPLEPLWIRGAGHNNLESARFQYEVFLRYMKVLQEFKRWRVPIGVDGKMESTSRKLDSFGALQIFVKAAGCFGPKNEDKEQENNSKKQSHRRRVHRLGSSSQILIAPLGNRHENQLRAMWQKEEEKEETRKTAAEQLDKRRRRRSQPVSHLRPGLIRGTNAAS